MHQKGCVGLSHLGVHLVLKLEGPVQLPRSQGVPADDRAGLAARMCATGGGGG